MTDFIWLLEETVLAFHEEQLAEHGGGVGIRDRGLLESALARPKQSAFYGNTDIAGLAAAYGFSLAKDHPFVDGNKRVAYVAMETFLALNGVCLTAGDADCVSILLQLASGEINEEGFADWLRKNTV